MSSPASAAPRLRSLYRRLLRELPVKEQTTRTAHQKLSAASPLQTRLRAQFATNTTSGTASASSTPSASASTVSGFTASQEAQVEQFIQYVQAQRMYATLIERYNPGMGMSEEERVRLSARRIGMNLPVEFEGEGRE